MNFWTKLQKPFFAVAPMADVTDASFRRMIAKYSEFPKLDNVVMWTEFVSADGLARATEEGKKKLMADLIYTEEERPIVAQLFSSNEDHMEKAARLCLELGFDGVDINMGCPDRSIEKQGCGSAMIKNPENAKAIIRATKRGCKSDTDEGIPVSVKTRLGYNEDTLEQWLPELLSENPAAITVHGRTRKQLSKVPADWVRIKKAVEIRNEVQNEQWQENNPKKIKTLIIGNGDVLSMEDAQEKVKQSGVDGAMIGRALFGNPWFFNRHKQLPTKLIDMPTHGVDRERIITNDVSNKNISYITLEDRLNVLVEHSFLFEELFPFKSFSVMKKHYKAYANGFPNAAHLRSALMQTDNATQVQNIVHQFLKAQSS